MVVDFGWAYWRREAAKTAASAAASGVVAAAGTTTPTTQASTACPSTINTSLPWNVGCDFAVHNGFTNGVNNRTVNIQISTNNASIPVTGVAPSKYWVSATVTETIPTLFSWVLGHPTTMVSARSTVGVYSAAGGGGGCIYVLDPSAHKSFPMTGANLTTGCGIYVFSTASDASYMTGGNLNLNGGASLVVHGGQNMSGGIITLSGGGNVSLSGTQTTTGGTISPAGALKQNQAWSSVSNPFSGMTTPTPASSCQADPKISGGTSNVIGPGTYCGISVSGGTGIQFNSGIYILKTGSLTISGGSFTSTTTNVLFYIPSSNATGQINITGGNMQWSGLSGNGADGFVFWSDNSAAQNVTGGNYTIKGVTYMPNSALKYTGGNGTLQTLVVDTLTVTGGNISQPASSAYFGAGSVSGTYIME